MAEHSWHLALVCWVLHREFEREYEHTLNLEKMLKRCLFLELWHEHEAGSTPEARLVRGVDRLNPALMRYLTGQGWQDVGADAGALDRLQLPRLEASRALTTLYQEVRDAAVAKGLLASASRPTPS
ncbi:HD domain-containing protein [Streptomyces sp. HUAS TT7]|uniref:HD domain-containing protein n=1 Tax=Streptomyces sp. HUAS TT7 TaxID=3447507 RepID=UPI003F65B5BF